jgi:galactose-1-phosphate uridylyltransferase
MVPQQLSREIIEHLLQAEDIEQFSYSEISQHFHHEEGILAYQPDHVVQQDPRSFEQVLFNTSRADRPHDNADREARHALKKPGADDCIICTGQTTGILDLAQLSEGYTFINKNLFPVVFPGDAPSTQDEFENDRGVNSTAGNNAHGLHFLQWTSTMHNLDWHNMPIGDLLVVMKRLAALEKHLLSSSQEMMPSLEQFGDDHGRSGYVSIIKNSGSPVGGSIEHGHQQIVFSNIMPRRTRENLAFQRTRGVSFSEYILQENPASLLVREYEHTVLVVPHYMRRPFDMLLLVKDTDKSYLHELSSDQLKSVAAGWQDGIKLLRAVLPLRHRAIAYNVLTHNGPGAGLYFEFLPYTQEEGGFEKLGLSVCQSNPTKASELLKDILGEARFPSD